MRMPREYWIEVNKYNEVVGDQGGVGPNSIHVVEYSALEASQARENILFDALKIAEAQLEGTLLMISEHGRNINVPFCLEYYERCSRDAKVALQKYNQAKAGSEG